MWKVTPPTHSALDTYRTCNSRVRSAELKARLVASETEVDLAARAYEAAADGQRLHTLNKDDFGLSQVSQREMIAAYENRLVKMDSPGRDIYNSLLMAPTDGVCPLCGHLPVSTLDHHLPKTEFPALAVNPMNLVPACSDCNKLKGNTFPRSAEEETLHPYYDDIENDPWLLAEVVETVSAALRFHVAPPPHWTGIQVTRARLHFARFKLANLYATVAAREISNIRGRLSTLLTLAGERTVRSHLLEEATSRKTASLNSWQSAAYTAMADSAWFCAGGFNP